MSFKDRFKQIFSTGQASAVDEPDGCTRAATLPDLPRKAGEKLHLIINVQGAILRGQ